MSTSHCLNFFYHIINKLVHNKILQNFGINKVTIILNISLDLFENSRNEKIRLTNKCQMIGLVWFYGISTIIGYLMPNSLYTYTLNIYDLVGFYGISTIIGYLMPNPLDTYTLNIYDLVGWVLWHINHYRLFNAKSSLYIYIKYIWFCLVGFYGISTIVGYLMPNPLYAYILNIYDL